MATGFAHLVLNVSDFRISERVYDAFLSALSFTTEYVEVTNDWAAKSYRCGQHNLWLKWEHSRDHQEFVRDVGLDHLSFLASSKEQVDDFFRLIESLGLLVTRTPRDYPEYSESYYTFYFRDPDGIPLEIVCK